LPVVTYFPPRSDHAVGSRGQSRVGNGPGAVTTELRIFDLIRADLLRACQGNQHRTDVFAYLRELFNPGTQAILCYRFGFWARALPVPIVRPLLRIVHFLLEYVFASRVGIHIPIRAEIGPGFVIHTWAGGLIMPGCKVGSNLTLIGGGVQFDWETESIGDDVWLGPGTKFVGKVRVGSRVRTAPNSVVMTDIPDDSTAFGNPARIVPARKWKFAPTGAAQAKAIAARRAQAEAAATSAPTPEK
jgi:serine O-acetyltransferase